MEGWVGEWRVAKSGRAQTAKRQGRTEPNESRRLGKAFPAYGTGDDDDRILNAGPEPTTRPPGTPRPCGREARDGDQGPVNGREDNGGVEDDSGMAVHGTQGAGAEGRSRNINAK